MAAKAASDGASTLGTSERPTIRPFGATVPPPRVDPSGHLWVGLGGAAVVALGVVLFWTRPIGNGEHSRPPEPAAARAAAHPVAPKIEPFPQKAESLPKAESARAVDEPFGNVALEASFPRAPVRPSTVQGAPVASAPLPHEATEGRRQRPNLAEQATAPDRAHPPPKPLADPSPSEPGVELRRLHTSRPRDIDEADPYAR
jgi:hypothetical protein